MSAGDLLTTAEVPQPSGLIRLCGGRPGSCREGVRPEGARLLAGGKKDPTPKVTVMMIAVCQCHARCFCVACHLTPISHAVPHDGGETGTSTQARECLGWAEPRDPLLPLPACGSPDRVLALSVLWPLPLEGDHSGRAVRGCQVWYWECSPLFLCPWLGPRTRPTCGLSRAHRKEPAGCKDFLHVSPSPPGPSTPRDLGLAPQPPGLRASWKVGPGAREGYLLRLSGPVDKTLSLGPGALNITFLRPLPSGHYALELRVLAGPYEARAQATAWLGGESGLVGNRLGSCPGAPALRAVDPHHPGPTPLQML